MTKCVQVPANGVNEIIAAINAIEPGQEVEYSSTPSARLGIGDGEGSYVKQAVMRAEAAGRVMLFQRRAPRGGTFRYVARGVAPGVKDKLERVASKAWEASAERRKRT